MDPFAHHPALQGRVTPPDASAFRHFRPADLDPVMAALGHPADWRYSDAEREARRLALLGPHLRGDLWVFAYGSLMWDPGFHFAEVRVGRTPAHERRFCLLDTFGARGTPEAPGLQAALVPGHGCTGLVFRLAAATVDTESEVVWRREGIADTYLPVFLPIETAQGPVQALAFTANPRGRGIALHLTRAQEVEYIATGQGRFGSSRAYLENLAAQFAALGIDDPDVTALLSEVRARSG
jgi:cation transport protein ChaC